MKTLTLFRACYFANGMVGDYKVKRMASNNTNTFIYRTKQMDKRIRQRNKLFHAVYERLQEQEELIAVLREYRDASKEEIHDLKMQRKDLIEALKEK